MSEIGFEAASFRDRQGRVWLAEGAVYRCLNAQAAADWDVLKNKSFFKEGVREGAIVKTEEVAPENIRGGVPSGDWTKVLEHEKIPFISYPYEWSFGMLKDAGLLQLDLQIQALSDGMTLKDASSFNVQWRGGRPVFIDTPSFERHTEGAPWAGYRQFCQMFLYPLFFQAYKNVPFHPWLRGAIDGITPEQCSRLMSLRDMLRPGVFSHAYLQAKLQSRFSDTDKDVRGDLKSAGFNKDLILTNLRGLKNVVSGLSWGEESSEWAAYGDSHSYTDEDHAAKKDFVRNAVAAKPRRLVWDVGCNRGDFSRIAAESAEYVIAMDADHLVVDRMYRSVVKDGIEKILPLVVNAADASPSLGWNGRERGDLASRGRPDMTLCLALIHHIVISNHVPLPEFVRWLAGLGGGVVVEFVSREDPMVKKLLRNKKDIYDDYSEENLEACLKKAFKIEKRLSLASGTRTLYHAEPLAQ